MSGYGLIILQSHTTTSWALECHMETAALCSLCARQLGLEAEPRCTCAALGASAKHKGQYQIFNVSDTTRRVSSLHRWHTVMDTNE